MRRGLPDHVSEGLNEDRGSIISGTFERMTEHLRIAQRRLASAGDKLGQWLQEAGTEWEAHGVVAADLG